MLNSVLTAPLTLSGLLICLAAAMVLGVLTALVFLFRARHSESFALTLALLPMAVTLVILLVNGNVGAGVAVAGAFALVRFRSVPGTAREIAAIFCAMALGLALGMGYIGVAVIFFLCVAAFTLALTALRFGAPAAAQRTLRITIPENVDYNGLFDDVFDTYHVRAELIRIKSSGMGTLFDLTYDATFPAAGIPKPFLDELRARNGNLTILVGIPGEHEAL